MLIFEVYPILEPDHDYVHCHPRDIEEFGNLGLRVSRAKDSRYLHSFRFHLAYAVHIRNRGMSEVNLQYIL